MQITQMLFTNNLEKYLGFKLYHGRISKDQFSHVLDRVSSKLTSWKGRLLNKPGRLTLKNAVLSSIPSYGMQTQWYPQSVCNFLDRTVKNFIWKGHGDKGMNRVNWYTITKPCRWGGHGVRMARKQNVALLGKLVWNLFACPDKLWVSLLSDKYLRNGSLLGSKKVKGSTTWNSIIKAWEVLKDGFLMKLGDGDTSFWYKPWLLKESLCEKVWMVDIHDIDLKIKDVFVNGEWKLNLLYTTLSDDIQHLMLNTHPRLVEGVSDCWTW